MTQQPVYGPGEHGATDTAWAGVRIHIDAETQGLLDALADHSAWLAERIAEATTAVALGAGQPEINAHGGAGPREPYQARDDGTPTDPELEHLRRLRKRHAARLRRALARLRQDLELDPPERGPRDAHGRLRVLVSDPGTVSGTVSGIETQP